MGSILFEIFLHADTAMGCYLLANIYIYMYIVTGSKIDQQQLEVMQVQPGHRFTVQGRLCPPVQLEIMSKLTPSMTHFLNIKCNQQMWIRLRAVARSCDCVPLNLTCVNVPGWLCGGVTGDTGLQSFLVAWSRRRGARCKPMSSGFPIIVGEIWNTGYFNIWTLLTWQFSFFDYSLLCKCQSHCRCNMSQVLLFGNHAS